MEKSLKLTELENQIRTERERIANEKQNRSKDLILDKGKLDIDLKSQQDILAAYKVSLNNITRSLEASSTTGKNLVEQQRETMVKLNATKDSQYTDTITCPMCSYSFVADPTALATWEANKQGEVTRLSGYMIDYKNR